MSVHAHAKQLLQEISAVLPPQDGQEDDEEMDDGWEDVEDGAADEAMDE